jgi:hypothetical protein
MTYTCVYDVCNQNHTKPRVCNKNLFLKLVSFCRGTAFAHTVGALHTNPINGSASLSMQPSPWQTSQGYKLSQQLLRRVKQSTGQ